MMLWDNTNPCDVSFDIVDDAEITTSIYITNKSTYDCRKLDYLDPVKVTTSVSQDNDKPWLDAQEDFDSWYDTSETMNDYNKWYKPPDIHEDIGISNEFINEHIKPDFYIGKRQT